MAVSGFTISSLTLIGDGVPNAMIQLQPGLNVIAGPSDTGKTFIVQCIDFMFGGSKAPKPIPESKHYHTARLCIRNGVQESEFELERALKGGDFRLRIDGQAERVLSAKNKAGNTDNISQFLLSLTGLTDKKVRTNQQGKTRDVSFRDLARLVVVDEESVISETSPVHSGQYTDKTVEAAVFRLLLTGMDDSSLIAVEDPKVARGRQAGKAEVLGLLLDRTKVRVDELGLTGNIVQWREKLILEDKLYAAAEAELAQVQQSAATLEQDRRHAWAQLRQIESKTAVLSELQNRFDLLGQQYESDLARLESTAEAGLRLGQMNEETCPVCGAAAQYHNHDDQQTLATPEAISQSCVAEIAKIKSLFDDLILTKINNAENISNLISDAERAKAELDAASRELQESLKPRIETALLKFRESQTQRDAYTRAIELTGRISEMENLQNGYKQKKIEKVASLSASSLRSDETEEFSKEVEELLRLWHFPNLDRVTFSESDQDIVISGRARATHGKGVRAIAHAAFNLALMSFCVRHHRPHPGIVLIDSPLVVYREPDVDEGGFASDVKDSFYRSIGKQFKYAQVIIFENEDPPQDVDAMANVIRFTKTPLGRSGFIP